MWFALNAFLLLLLIPQLIVSGGLYDEQLERLASLAMNIVGIGPLGALLRLRGFRWKAQAWLVNLGGQSQAAAAIAGLVGGKDSKEVLQVAGGKFRCISCELLTEEILKDSTPNVEYFALSKEARLGEVDAFISHSWSDNPAAKWKSLQIWRSKFKAKYGREPTVWLDKVCIDQSDIQANLLCLPVFLSACQKLVIFAGSTYLSRLWCVLEVFIFIEMGGARRHLDVSLLDEEDENAWAVRPTMSISSVESSCEKLRALFAEFDVKDATCYLTADRDRLLGIVESGCGGLEGFNAAVRATLLKVSEPMSV